MRASKLQNHKLHFFTYFRRYTKRIISLFVNNHLQPLVKSLASYIKDTTNFLNKIKDTFKNLQVNTILVAINVKSLYTNIPNQEGIDVVRSQIPVITSFLGLILTLKNFTFNDKHFLQTSGASMGTKCIPSYVNLFTGNFKKTHILPHL